MHASAPTDLDQLIHALRDILFYAKNGIGQQIDVVDASEEMAVIDEDDASPQLRGAIEQEQALLKDALQTVLAATAVPLPVPAGDTVRWTLRLRVAAIGLFRYAETPRPAFVNGVKVEPPRRVLKAARRLVGAIDTLEALALALSPPTPTPTPTHTEGDGRENAAAPFVADAAPDLTDKQRHILEALLDLDATAKSRRETLACAVERFNRFADPANYKREASDLVRAKLLCSASGPSGGYWLTPEGKRVAEKSKADAL